MSYERHLYYSEIVFFEGHNTANFWCSGMMQMSMCAVSSCGMFPWSEWPCRNLQYSAKSTVHPSATPLVPSIAAGHVWPSLRRRHARTDHFRINRWGTSSVRGHRATNVTWRQWVYDSLSRLFRTNSEQSGGVVLRWAVFVEMASVHENAQLAQETGAAWSTQAVKWHCVWFPCPWLLHWGTVRNTWPCKIGETWKQLEGAIVNDWSAFDARRLIHETSRIKPRKPAKSDEHLRPVSGGQEDWHRVRDWWMSYWTCHARKYGAYTYRMGLEPQADEWRCWWWERFKNSCRFLLSQFAGTFLNASQVLLSSLDHFGPTYHDFIRFFTC